MKRTRASVDELKQQIQNIVGNAQQSVDEKIRSIFRIDKPSVVPEGEGLNPWLNAGAWRELKTDRSFWATVIRKLGFVDYDAVNEYGNRLFGLPEIHRILGQHLANEIIAQGDLYALPTMEAHQQANEEFISYMNWYDENASRNYLILYGRYLNIEGQLVSLARTRQQGPSLRFTPENAYHVISQLLIMDKGEPYLLWFTMKKPEMTLITGGPSVSYLFTIRLGDQKVELPMNGPIKRVLKFFYQSPTIDFTGVASEEQKAQMARPDTTFVVISGPDDSKLLRFSHKNIRDVLIVDKFEFSADHYDDLNYVNSETPSRFATNRKSIQNVAIDFTNVEFLDLSKFRLMLPQRVASKEEIKSQQKKLIEERGVGNVPAEYTELQFAYNYAQFGNLFVLMNAPLTARFKFGSILAYESGDVVPLSVKLVRMPFESNSSYACIAILARLYINNEGGSQLQLRLYRYQRNVETNRFSIGPERVLDLPSSFLTPSTPLCDYAIQEFNLIFHTGNIFYVEVLERKLCNKLVETHIVSSGYLAFDFKFVQPQQEPVIQLYTIKDNLLFEEIRVRGYKVYDYRHDEAPMIVGRKYDAIFYKYNYVTRYARIIFYKAQLDRASVASLYVEKVPIEQVLAFVFVRAANEVAYMTFKEDQIGKITMVYPFEPYIEGLVNLSKSFKEKVKITDDAGDNTPVCALCHQEASVKDTVTGALYCDSLCQYIYCETNRL